MVEDNEIKEEVKERSSFKWLIWIVLIFSILIVFAIFLYLKPFLLRKLPKQFLFWMISVSTSMFIPSLIIFFITPHFKREISIILIISFFSLVTSIIIFLIVGPLSSQVDQVKIFFRESFRQISIQLCYINAEISGTGHEKCLPKEYKKLGVKIEFENNEMKINPPPTAGKKYKLTVFIKNENEVENEDIPNSVYDIKIKNIEGIASPSEDFESGLEVYASESKEFVIKPKMIYPVNLNFVALPSSCKGRFHFKVTLTAEFLTIGSSKVLSLPQYSYDEDYEKIASKMKILDKSVFSSPGPLNVTIWSVQNPVTKQNKEEFQIQINIGNALEGVASLKDIQIGVQRDYIKIIDCENVYGEILTEYPCNMDDMKSCIKLLIDENIPKGKSFMITCNAKIEGNYKEEEALSAIVAIANYLYNFEETYSLEALGCTKPSSSVETSKCEYPNICYKYSCPEGYEEVEGSCDIADSVCCKPIETTRDDDCPDLTNNCQTGELLIKKIACEARKEGVPPEIMIGIAKVESNLNHCYANGVVKSGDGGVSIGLMQTSQCSDTGDVHNINENIRCAIKKIKEKCGYSRNSIIRENVGRCNPTGYCTEGGVRCEYCYNVEGREPKVYYGWDIAVRGYNGWGGCLVDANYNYVENVKNFASQYAGKV
ncbi:MAG: hypothetical protein QXO84_00020 [Candidatus Aenigmatarchaeota archaeon]